MDFVSFVIFDPPKNGSYKLSMLLRLLEPEDVELKKNALEDDLE